MLARAFVWGWLLTGGVAFAQSSLAIAPVPVGAKAPPELQRALMEELPGALAAAGFAVKEPKEVDLKVAERPELLRCTTGGCLAEEAAFLQVARLALPRLEPAPPTDREGGLTVGVVIFDAAANRIVAQVVDRCGATAQPCVDAGLRQIVQAQAKKLFAQVTQPGTLDVRAQPPARCSVDGKAVGETPWHGELEPGDHVVVLESGGQRVQRDVRIAPGRAAVLEVTLDSGPRVERHGRFHVVKWVALGLGLASAAAGAALWGIDGRGSCSLSGMQKQCPQVYDTLPAGAALVGVGAAFVVTSVIMLAVDKPRPVAAALAPIPGGAALTVGGRF